MFEFDNIYISFSSDITLLIAGSILLILFTYWIYKVTIPPLSPIFKSILILIRISALVIIFILIFEPKITVEEYKEEPPMHYMFIDNSSSILLHDSIITAESIRDLKARIESEFEGNINVYAFGSEIFEISEEKGLDANFNDTQTDLSSIFDFLADETDNLASISIVSDGIITNGEIPIYAAERLGLPIFTIGAGDTTQRRDLELSDVIYNEYIYSGVPTVLSVSLNNFGFAGSSINVTLSENNKLIETKNVRLDNSNPKRIEFEYTPNQPGDQKLTFGISQLEGEMSFSNNTKTLFLNILKSKIKIALLTSSLSPDFSFIRNSLSGDPNYEINPIVELNKNYFIEPSDYHEVIDSSDILYILNFPGSTTSEQFLSKVFDVIENGKPFFIQLGSATSIERLREFNSLLPFEVQSGRSSNLEVQPVLRDETNPLFLSFADNPVESWNNLPPVPIPTDRIGMRAGSNLLATAKANNVVLEIPLVVSRSIGSNRSIGVSTDNIWRWKLQADKEERLFDSFVRKTAKWLSTPVDNKRVKINPVKKLFTLKEKVSFNGQVYDETLTPIDNAEVKVNIKGADGSYEIFLAPIGQGIYSGNFESQITGDFTFSAEVSVGEKQIGMDNGKFTISRIEIEKINQIADHNLLKLMSNLTNGRFFELSSTGDLPVELRSDLNKKPRITPVTSELIIWTNELVLILVIFLFGLEWFLRKRSGML